MNFCSANLGSQISTNGTPEADGHEATNLLHSDQEKAHKVSLFQNFKNGFIADHFVRPPVKLTVKFPCCIEISHIVIRPKVGRQVSTAFLVETETSFKNWTKEKDGDAPSKHIVSKEFISKDPDPDRIIFRNPRFNLRKTFWRLPTIKDFYQKLNDQDITFGLRHPSNNALERVVALDLTILRTGVSSVPAIGSLEIWGQPCTRCPTEQVQKLIDIFVRNDFNTETEQTYSPVLPHDKPERDLEDEDEPTRKRVKLFLERNSERQKLDNVEMPDDFLDSLTYEVMVQPIRLPSGLAVDSSTLGRYFSEEAVHGRLPNDPFTGIVFTDNLKPLADSALKSRIDLFLTQNADSPAIKSLPRRLGAGFYTTNSVSVTSNTISSSFIPSATVSKKIESSCVFCKIKWDSTSAFFAGLCAHIKVCRNCLATQDKNKINTCTHCGIPWKANECRRVFLQDL